MKKILIIFTVLGMVPTLPVQAQNQITETSRWAHGPSRAVAVQDSIAYVSNGGYLSVFDLHDPVNPAPMENLLIPETLLDFDIAGNFTYGVAEETGLHIYDISAPDAPESVGTLEFSGDALSIDVMGDYAYISVGEDGILTVDISDETAPQEVGEYATDYYDTYSAEPNSIVSAGDYIYVATSDSGLRVLDASDPADIQAAGSYNYPALFANDVKVVGDVAYVISGESDSGFVALDVSNPASPSYLGSLDIPGDKISIVGDIAYVLDIDIYNGDNLYLVDITDPANMNQQSSSALDAGGFGLDVSGQIAVVTNWLRGITVYDASDVNNPTEAAEIITGGTSQTLAVSDNYAILGQEETGVPILDISDPATPQKVGFYKPDYDDVMDVAVRDTLLYVANDYYGVQIVSIADPANPVEVGEFGDDSDDGATEIVLHDTLAFVQADAGTQIYSIASPASPVLISTYSSNANDVAVQGNYMYAATGEGFDVVDLSEMSSPEVVGSFETGGYGGAAIAVRDTVVLVCEADRYDGVFAISVSDPANPYELGENGGGRYNDIHIQGNYACVAADDDGLVVLDLNAVNDFSESGLVAEYETDQTAYSLSADEDYVYLADGDDGLYILETDFSTDVNSPESLPDEFILSQNYPNPFNPTTTIRFSLSVTQTVTLDVYNITGKKVHTLVKQQNLSAGEHTYQFVGDDLSSGIYFYTISTGEASITRKMTLVK